MLQTYHYMRPGHPALTLFQRGSVWVPREFSQYAHLKDLAVT